MIHILQRGNWGLEKLNDQIHSQSIVNASSHPNSTSRFYENKTLLSTTQTNCPLWQSNARYGICRYGKRAHSKRAHSKISWKSHRANIVANGSTRKGQELGDWVTLSEKIEQNHYINQNFLWQFLVVLRVKRSSELNMFHLNGALIKMKHHHFT